MILWIIKRVKISTFDPFKLLGICDSSHQLKFSMLSNPRPCNAQPQSFHIEISASTPPPCPLWWRPGSPPLPPPPPMSPSLLLYCNPCLQFLLFLLFLIILHSMKSGGCGNRKIAPQEYTSLQFLDVTIKSWSICPHTLST